MVERARVRRFRWLLHTNDAHDLYASSVFAPPDATLLERPYSWRG